MFRAPMSSPEAGFTCGAHLATLAWVCAGKALNDDNACCVKWRVFRCLSPATGLHEWGVGVT
jgi:hypothetical protein